MVLTTATFPYARQTGLGSFFREGLNLPQITIAIATTITITAFIGLPYLISLATGITFALGFSYWCSTRLNGGLTGDIYGAVCEVTEFTCLLTLTIQNL
jgi:adenosylcobinamide-GDP ribazoletransferase